MTGRDITMHRRDFIFRTTATLAVTVLAATGCRPTVMTRPDMEPEPPPVDRRREKIDTAVDAALSRLYSAVPDSLGMAGRSAGVMVFPDVVPVGLGLGGSYAEGALRIGQSAAGYYQLTSVSPALATGIRPQSVIFFFLTPQALDEFRRTPRWDAGAGTSLNMRDTASSGAADAIQDSPPIVALLLTEAGLMPPAPLDGTHITPMPL